MKRPKTPKRPGMIDTEREAALMSERERRRLILARGRASTVSGSPMGDTSRPLMGIVRAYAKSL